MELIYTPERVSFPFNQKRITGSMQPSTFISKSNIKLFRHLVTSSLLCEFYIADLVTIFANSKKKKKRFFDWLSLAILLFCQDACFILQQNPRTSAQ